MSTGYESNYPTTGYGSDAQLRNEFQKIQEALGDALSRSGANNSDSLPNSMHVDLDMDSNNILNVNSLDAQNVSIGGVDILEQVGNTAAQSAIEAAQEASRAEQEADRSKREADRAAKLAGDMGSGYQFAGDYAADIEITEYNQLLRDSNGEFWRVSGQVDLPYTTTGTGLPEDDAFIPAGDAVLRQDLADPDRGAAMVARAPICVDSIAELMALPPSQRKEGVRYLVRRFSVANSSGIGEFYWDASSTQIADGAYTIAVSGVAVGRFIRARKERSIFAQDFGGIVSEGSEVITKALSLTSLLRVGTMVGKGPAGVQTVFLDTRHYQLSSTVNLPFSCEIDGQGSVISAAEGLTRLFYAATAYRVKFKNIIFLGDDVEAFWSESPNLDNSRVEFENCFFWTTTRTPDRYAVHIKNQSSRVVFTECDVWDAPNYINVSSDFFCINGGWINGYSAAGTKPENSCSIKTKSPTVINNAVFIPEADGSGVRPGIRWIDSYSKAIQISDSHFGGENGGMPTIYQFEQLAAITVKSSLVSCGANLPTNGIVVLQNDVIPGQYTFSDLRLVTGPVVTSRGYNPELTQAETDELLRARLRAMSLSEVGRSKIVVSQCSPSRIPSVIDCITNLHHTQKGSASPASLPANTTTTLNIAQLYKGNLGLGEEHATISFKLRAMLSASSSFVGISQVKEVQVFAHYNSGAPVRVHIIDTAFSEAPTSAAVGDTVISFSVVAGSNTGAGAQLQMTIAAGNWSGGVSASYSVSEIDTAESNLAKPAGVLRLFSHA